MIRPISCCLLFLALTVSCNGPSKEDLLQEGMRFEKEGNSRGAIVLFRNALEKDPNFFEARYQLGRAYMEAGKLEAAEREFLKVSLQSPGLKDLSLDLAELYVRMDRMDEAIETAGEYRRKNPENATASEILGRARLMKGDLDGAEEMFLEAQRLTSDSTAADLGLANLYLKRGEEEKARQILEKITAGEKMNLTASEMLAGIEYSQGNRARALELYQEISRIDTGNIKPLFMSGILLLDEGRTSEGRELGMNASRRFPESGVGSQLQGLADYLDGDFESAVFQLQKSVEKEPSLTAYYFRGLSYLRLEKFEMALNDFQKILDYRPDSVPVRTLVAVTLMRQKRVEEAQYEAEKVLAADPRNALAHNILGSIFLAGGQYDAAMAELDKAATLDPRMTDARMKKGLFHLSRGEMKQGEAEILQAAEAAPELLNPRLILASHYLRQAKFSEAIGILEKSLTGQESDALLYNYLAAAHFGRREPEEAVRCLEAAKKAKPDYLTPAYNLANFWISKGELSRARDEYLRILDIRPGEGKAMLHLGDLFEASGDDSAAKSWYGRARRSGTIEGYLGVATHLLRKGDSAVALEVVREGLGRYPGHPQLEGLEGSLLLDRGEPEEAVRIFTSLEEKSPGRWVSHLTRALLQQNNPGSALAATKAMIGRNPKAPYGYLAQAALLEKGGDLEKAQDVLTKGIEAGAGKATLLLELGRLLEKAGRDGASAEAYQQILQEYPDHAPALFALGMLNDRKGEKKKALELYRKVLEKADDFVPALNNVAYLYANVPGKGEEALALATRAYQLEPENPSVMDTLGYTLFKNGQAEKAEGLLKRAAGILKSEPTVHYHLALVLHERGDTEMARQALKRALELGPFPDAEEAGKMMARLSQTVRSHLK